MHNETNDNNSNNNSGGKRDGGAHLRALISKIIPVRGSQENACRCNAIQWMELRMAMAGTNRSKKVPDVLCDECATRFVGSYSNN